MIAGTDSHGQTLFSCDICGRDTRLAIGDSDDRQPGAYDNSHEGHFSYQGAYGSRKYDLETWKAELCEKCTEEIRGVIDKLADERGGRGVTVIDGLEADERFCQEVLGKGSSEVLRGGPDHEENRARYRDWVRETFKVEL